LNAVKCLLKRLRRALEAEERWVEDQRTAWLDRLAERKAGPHPITAEQAEMIARFGQPSAFHTDGSITIAFDDGDSVKVAR
ncbi:hypothetical protein, partial [Actinoplanes sp. DH11]|uniref:hypothetical protein n=1 Tax=Actinoplanes sp. DH11 TaxID=2857011 RepID=UPI001E57C5AD